MSAAVHSSRFCKGKHSVDGGCGNDNCRGKELCVAGCATCPDFVAEYDGDTNQHCRGEHPVTGGCANEACRGLKLCQPDCTNCPDFQNYLTAKKRGPIAGSFWERPGSAMRLYMACLAGPADPETRNDIHLMQKLQARFQVPQDNYWLLLEKQVSLRSVHATVADVAASMEADDATFLYLGGHGSAGTETEMYRLGSYYGSAEGETLAPFLWDCPGRIFLVVDSCHAGAMIGDLARFASEHPRKLRCPELTVLTSVQSHLTACTGWKLIGMLIQRLVDAPSLPSEPIDIAKWAASTLRTASAKQRAQYAYFKGGQLVEASDQRVEGS